MYWIPNQVGNDDRALLETACAGMTVVDWVSAQGRYDGASLFDIHITATLVHPCTQSRSHDRP